MKCKYRATLFLIVGIAAGFIISTLLQSLLLSSLAINTDNTVVRTTSTQLYERSPTATDSSTRAHLVHTSSVTTPPHTITKAPPSENSQHIKYAETNWQARQKLQTDDSNLPVLKLSDELLLRQPVIIAIITSVHKLKSQTMAIHGTWAKKEMRKVLYFTGDVETMPHLPHGMEVIQLEGINDMQANWDVKEFSVIKYLISHFMEQVDWFLVTNDEVFLNVEALTKTLNQYRSNVHVYMGRSVPGSGKCNPLTGVVYSHGLLSRLETYLPQCQGEGQSISECIVLRGIHCTQAKEAHKLFYFDEKRVVESTSLFNTQELTHAVTVHPVRYPKYMYRLHSYFLEMKYNTSSETAKVAANDIRITHPFIPTHLRSPYKLGEEEKQGVEKQGVVKEEPSTNVPVRPSHIPKNKFEVNFWEYFNQTRMMSVYNEQPSHGIIGGLREEARYVLTKAIYLANQGIPPQERLMFEKLENGYHRIDPMRGSEYILDFLFRKNSDRSIRVRKRVSLLRPFHEAVVPVTAIQKTRRVHFVVTLSGLSNRLEQFLTNFERNILTQKEDASLTIVLFKGLDDDKVHTLVDKYVQRYPSTSISIVETEGEFARGVGLDKGASHFKDNDLLFFVDVDLEVKTSFIHRCQLNAVQNKQVYFPIFFKLYHIEFVNRYYKGNETQLLSRHNGHWAHYSYGMVCIYTSDYHRSGGFNIKMHGWGEEDIDFLNRVMSHGLEVFRSPDPGLVHLWHRKVCDRSKVVSLRAYRHCLQSKAENLADRTELAQYVFERELSQGNVL